MIVVPPKLKVHTHTQQGFEEKIQFGTNDARRRWKVILSSLRGSIYADIMEQNAFWLLLRNYCYMCVNGWNVVEIIITAMIQIIRLSINFIGKFLWKEFPQNILKREIFLPIHFPLNKTSARKKAVVFDKKKYRKVAEVANIFPTLQNHPPKNNSCTLPFTYLLLCGQRKTKSLPSLFLWASTFSSNWPSSRLTHPREKSNNSAN